jgi:hypothetical protein
LKVENVQVYGLEESIRRAKFPMSVDVDSLNHDVTQGIITLGKSSVGSGHDNFLNGIVIQFDLTFSNKAWVEAERYHFFDFVSSQSTMHRITQFKLKDQCNKYVDSRIIDIVQEKIDEYNRLKELDKESHSDSRTELLKELYLEILYNIPSGFELTAGMTTNYRQLKTIYHQRKTHRLPEWREFCAWIETLPKFKEICLGE